MGPNETRLRAALAPAARAQVEAAEISWREGAVLLEQVAGAIDLAREPAKEGLGRATALAAEASFAKVRDRVNRRAQEMRSASDALAQAGEALRQAETVRNGWDADGELAQPTAPDWSDDEVEQIRQLKVHHSRMAAYQSQYDARETQAQQTLTQLDLTYRDSADTMKKVHGEAVPTGGGGGGTGDTGGSGGRAPVGGVGTPPSGAPRTPDGPGPTTGGPDGPGGGHGGGPVTPPSGPVPGTPQVPMPGTTPPPGGVTPVEGSPTTAVPTVGGLAGALGGGLLGGAVGIGGAVRGGVTGVPVNGSTSTTRPSSARAIGSTSRTATGGALGRGAAAAAGSPTRATGASPAGTRAGAAAGSGATRGTRAGATAGQRGARGPVGTGGRTGRRSQEDEKRQDEFFEEAHDWVDDEGAAPGVID